MTLNRLRYALISVLALFSANAAAQDKPKDIAAFLQALWTQGYDGPVGVEVLNEYIRKWPLETAAREAFVKTTQVVTAAREKWEAAQTSRTSP